MWNADLIYALLATVTGEENSLFFQASANWKDDDMKLVLLPGIKPAHRLYSSAACRMGSQNNGLFGKVFS